jgi:hypothetical protein
MKELITLLACIIITAALIQDAHNAQTRMDIIMSQSNN